MSKTEKIQQMINVLNRNESPVFIMEIPKGFESAVKTMSKNKIFFTAKKLEGLIFEFTRIK